MNVQSKQNGRCPEMIRLLTFSVMGVKMAVDAEQIVEIMELEGAKKRAAALHFIHEKISFGKRQVSYRAPKALLLKEGGTVYALVIDNPDDLVAVDIEFIQPLPPLIFSQGGAGAFWGAVAEGDGVTLLVDFSRIGKK